MEHAGDEQSQSRDDQQLHSQEHSMVPASLLPSVLSRLGLGDMPSLLNAGVDELLAALDNQEIPVRVAAVRSIREHRTTMIDRLVTALNDPAWEVRVAAVWALGECREQAPLEALMRAAKDEDGSVRAAALRTLGLLGDRVSIEPLVRALDDPDWQVREIAVLTLGEREEQAPQEPLLARLNDEHAAVREAARMTLEQFRSKGLVDFPVDSIVKPGTATGFSVREQEQPWIDAEVEASAKVSSIGDSPLVQFIIHMGGQLSKAIRHTVTPLPDAQSPFFDDETSNLIAGWPDESNTPRQPARSNPRRFRPIAERVLAALIILGIGVSWLVIAQRLHPSQSSASAIQQAYQGQVDGPPVWSSDSKYVSFHSAPTSTTETVFVWERATGQLTKHTLHTLLANSQRMTVFAPDGKHLAFVETDANGKEAVQVWDTLTWHHILTTYARTLLPAVLWATDSTRIVIPSDSGAMQVWSIATGHQLVECQVPPLDLLASNTLLSPDGQRVLYGYGAQKMHIVDLTTCKLLILPSSDTNFTAWSPQGNRFASISLTDASMVQVWDAQTGRSLARFHLASSLSTISWTPDGTRIVISGDKEVEVADVATQRIVLNVIPASTLLQLVWDSSPDGTRIATLDGANTVQLWDAVTGHKLDTYQNQGKSVKVMAWSPDSRSLATGSIDGTGQVWSGNREPEIFHSNSSIILNITWSPDGKFIAAGGLDGSIWIWPVN